MLRALPTGLWNYTTAAHLLNRAGFGGTPKEIQRAVEAGMEKTVDWLLIFEAHPEASAPPDWAKPDPDRFKDLRAMREASEEKRKELRQMEQREQRQHLGD